MGAMKPTSTTRSAAEHLLVTFGFGVPGGALLIILLWWLLTSVADPATAHEWWEHALVLLYILTPVWAPLLVGFATLRLAARLGWADLRNL
jgi:hypothetical protein